MPEASDGLVHKMSLVVVWRTLLVPFHPHEKRRVVDLGILRSFVTISTRLGSAFSFFFLWVVDEGQFR